MVVELCRSRSGIMYVEDSEEGGAANNGLGIFGSDPVKAVGRSLALGLTPPSDLISIILRRIL